METAFETFLISKGYIKHILNCKTMKFELAKGHTISTMVNLDHRYIHESDKNLLDKIASGKSVMDKEFTWDDRRGEICFGLNEAYKPPTLCSPRPRILVKRQKDDKIYYENEQWDDSMNIVLNEVKFEEIFKAMFDKSVVFEFDYSSAAGEKI